MNLPLFIAFRYFRARRSRHIINWISRISVAGITLGTMALVIVLSVFNGLDHLIRSLFNSFDPDIRITAVEGKSFTFDSSLAGQLASAPGVAVYCRVIEENALLKYRDRQSIATVKGVGPEFTAVSGIDSMLIDGETRLAGEGDPMALIGQALAGELGVGLNFINPLHLYVPKRTDKLILNPLQAINHRFLFPSGVFAVQQEYDSKYLVVPVGFAQELFGYGKDEVTALEIKSTAPGQAGNLRKELQRRFGPEFSVDDRLGQHESFYRVMKSEKWAIFLILSFILIIASFNTISSLTLLILEKKEDMGMLRSMGAGPNAIRKIFLWEGLLVTGTGLLIGLLLGAAVCFIQQRFGIIRFPASGSFVVNVYPVRMLFTDFLLVAGLVGVIGWLAAWIPMQVMRKRYAGSD